ncbi:hypothetical protein PR002_g25911 [Phytophthora rubi]|uniref:Uncharacterized protein n=1 Tax=Phytophthora rubi TaxID=129364 RepID=A0A6A3HV33_9STRA|nr:hypothetical protein PR002_g25911 [Phytophthora rubi]
MLYQTSTAALSTSSYQISTKFNTRRQSTITDWVSPRAASAAEQVVKKLACGISALYQLTFVLETQALFVQSTLIVWLLETLTYRVVHFGCDFSFKFEWVGR